MNGRRPARQPVHRRGCGGAAGSGVARRAGRGGELTHRRLPAPSTSLGEHGRNPIVRQQRLDQPPQLVPISTQAQQRGPDAPAEREASGKQHRRADMTHPPAAPRTGHHVAPGRIPGCTRPRVHPGEPDAGPRSRAGVMHKPALPAPGVRGVADRRRLGTRGTLTTRAETPPGGGAQPCGRRSAGDRFVPDLGRSASAPGQGTQRCLGIRHCPEGPRDVDGLERQPAATGCPRRGPRWGPRPRPRTRWPGKTAIR